VSRHSASWPAVWVRRRRAPGARGARSTMGESCCPFRSVRDYSCSRPSS
jgi:hypothetical protein